MIDVKIVLDRREQRGVDHPSCKNKKQNRYEKHDRGDVGAYSFYQRLVDSLFSMVQLGSSTLPHQIEGPQLVSAILVDDNDPINIGHIDFFAVDIHALGRIQARNPGLWTTALSTLLRLRVSEDSAREKHSKSAALFITILYPQC